MNKHQFERITEWQKETFPDSTAQSKIKHLREEVDELIVDVETNNPNRRLEFADCFILLMGAAASDGMTYWDVLDAINEKHKINLTRKWGKPDVNGVVKHIDQ